MGVVAKQSITNFFTSYIGVIIGAVNTILLFPHIFTATEFGLTRVIVSAAMLASALFSFGLPGIIIKFFPFFKTEDKKHNGFLFTILVLPLLGYSLFLLVSIGLQDNIIEYYSINSPLFGSYYSYAIILTLYLFYINVLDAFLRSLYKSVIYNFLDNIVLKSLWMILIVLYFLKLIDFNEFIFGYVNAYGLLVLIEVAYLIYIKEFNLIPDFKSFNLKNIKEMSSFGLLTMFGAGVTGTAATIDSLIIGFLDKSGLAGVAFYSIAYYVSFLIIIPFNSLIRISNTSISEAWKNNDLASIKDLYKRSSNNLLLIGTLVFLGIWLNVDSLFYLMPTEYRQAKFVLFFICMAKLFEISVGISGMIVYFSKHYKMVFYINLLLIFLLVVTDLMLIPVIGIVGAAVATLISTFIIISIYVLYLYKKYKFLPFNNKSYFTIILALITYLIVNAIPYNENWILNVSLRSIATIVLFVPAVYYLKISPGINQFLQKRLGFIIRKNKS